MIMVNDMMQIHHFCMQKQKKKKKKKQPNKFTMNNLYHSDLHHSTIQQIGKEVWFWGPGRVLFMVLHYLHQHFIVICFWPRP